MNILKKLILFFGCNIAGSFLPPILYQISLNFHLIDINAENFNFTDSYVSLPGEQIAPTMVIVPLITTWVICALFSFSYFFVGKKWKNLFLIAPAILPLLHSIIILIQSM